MREIAKQIFDTAVAIAPGVKNFGPEVSAEIGRLFAHGANELASANHTGSAWVQYGIGQQMAKPDYGQDHVADQAMEQVHEQQHEMERER